MKIKNILLLGLLFILLFIANVSAYDKIETDTFYTVQLPQSKSYNYSFVMSPNTTLYFDMINDNSEIDFDLVDSYIIDSNETNYTLQVNWEIDDNIFASNKNLFAYLNVTNNKTSNSYTIGYNISIVKSTAPILVLNGTSIIQTINGTFYKIITLNNLPDIGEIPLTIKGTPNEKFSLNNCSNFLTCDNITTYDFDSNGQATIPLKYNVEINTAIGQYKEYFWINSVARNDMVEIIFDIKIPDIFITPLELPEKCYQDNQPLEVQVDCERLIQEYRLELIKGYQEYISKVNTEKICSQFVEKEYIVGDVISELILNKYNEVLDENKYLREDDDFSSKKILELESLIQTKETEYMNSILKKDTEIQNIKEQCYNDKVEINTVTKDYIDDKDNTRRNWYKRFALILMICPIIVLGAKKLFKNAWNINISIPDIVLLILFIMGLILSFVLMFAL